MTLDRLFRRCPKNDGTLSRRAQSGRWIVGMLFWTVPY